VGEILAAILENMSRIFGAITGSSIAVVFSEHEKDRISLWKRLSLGVAVGFISTPIAIGYFELPNTTDYQLAVAAFCGLVSYAVLEAFFGQKGRAIIGKVVKKKLGIDDEEGEK